MAGANPAGGLSGPRSRAGALDSRTAVRIICCMTAEPSPSAGRMRASDADREAVVEQLREAAAEGRIDLEELDERLGLALTARTHAELAPSPMTWDRP